MTGAMWRVFAKACAWLTGYALFTGLTRGSSPAHFYNPLVVSLGLLYLAVQGVTSVRLRYLTLLSAALGLWHGVLALAGRALVPSDDTTRPAVLLATLILYGAVSGAGAGAVMRWQLKRQLSRRPPQGS